MKTYVIKCRRISEPDQWEILDRGIGEDVVERDLKFWRDMTKFAADVSGAEPREVCAFPDDE